MCYLTPWEHCVINFMDTKIAKLSVLTLDSEITVAVRDTKEMQRVSQVEMIERLV